MNVTTEIYYTSKDQLKMFLVRIDGMSDNEHFCIVSVYDVLSSPLNNSTTNEKNIPNPLDYSVDPPTSESEEITNVNNANSSLIEICLKKIELNMQVQTKENLLYRFEATEVFIGEDLTSIDESNDGLVNSILVKLLGTNEYVYISDCVFSFKTDSHIIDLRSFIKNQNTPSNTSNTLDTKVLTYAIDMNNRCYLMNEYVIMNADNNNNDLNYWNCVYPDPYEYYYKITLITPDIRYVIPIEPVHKYFEEIKKFFINNKEYTLRYTPNPEEVYDTIINEHSNNGYKPFISVTDTENISYGISREQFVDIMKEFGNIIACKSLSVKIIKK